MNRRMLTYTLAALFLAQGCVDDSYRGAADDPYRNPPERVPILISLADPDDYVPLHSTQSKSGGPVNGMSDWTGREIYVYAFNKDLQTDFGVTSLRDNIQCLVDGSIDEPGSLAGKRARVTESGFFLDWVGTEKNVWYHQGEHATQNYDFFAYYIADMPLTGRNFHRGGNQVKLDIEIDGSQDVMSAKAELTQDQVALFTEDDRKKIEEYTYSYYTGSRGVQPKFLFQHHLAKIDFEIRPGYLENAVKRIYVESIKVESRYKASFTVADKSTPSQLGLSFAKDRKLLYLAEPDGSELVKGRYGIETLKTENQVPTPVHVGGSLLIAPGDSELTAFVKLKEVRLDGTVVPAEGENEITLRLDNGTYELGNRYLVRLTLFGTLNIESSIEMTEWEDGGDIFIDTEDKME